MTTCHVCYPSSGFSEFPTVTFTWNWVSVYAHSHWVKGWMENLQATRWAFPVCFICPVIHSDKACLMSTSCSLKTRGSYMVLTFMHSICIGWWQFFLSIICNFILNFFPCLNKNRSLKRMLLNIMFCPCYLKVLKLFTLALSLWNWIEFNYVNYPPEN